MKKEILATNVTMKVKIHKALEFRNEDTDLESQTILKKKLGIVDNDTEITFEYRMKSSDVLAQMKDIEFEELTQIPFQTQIEYTKMDGMKCLRVITAV